MSILITIFIILLVGALIFMGLRYPLDATGVPQPFYNVLLALYIIILALYIGQCCWINFTIEKQK